jgi:hypothetical protein
MKPPQKAKPRPKRLRVMNLNWSIVFVDKKSKDATEAWAWCDPSEQTIFLCEDQKPDAMADSFLHETLHAIVYSLGANVKEEENIVHRMATGLCTVWKQNPSAFKWWESLL